ncbi:MAG: phosphoglucomutase/phosphomannomutase family protein [Dehalococcoidia bacterium]|nr:phosphoglucomutase/phosphomannomutase family protein [Dehalococcoidia bacterium]MSQ17930.1 phosphoglucomutase/phosphomannomutase family protein [Dehalococcoidia bacterium]
MPAKIKFGTDGWRAIIAQDFTFDNVTRCAQGLVDYLTERGTAAQGLVVGHDTRFLSREFAETVAQVAAANGLHVYLADKAAPTPVLSFSVLHRHAGGAAIITASHNSANYNGFKFKPEYGGSATQEITDQLEECIQAVRRPKSIPLDMARARGLVEDFDPAPPYVGRIQSLVHLPTIQNAGLKVMVDAMFGAGAGYLPRLISGGRTTVEELHGVRNPAFPGMEQPEPIAQNLTELASSIPQAKASVGLALDGDADRVGLLDEGGNFITTLQVFSLLALYLLEQKGERGALVKGVTSSSMLNQLGEKFGVAVHEMPVGFKHIGPKFTEVDALMGGEESGGFAFRGHIPERDGILSALYLLEFMARTGKSPAELVQHLFQQVGPHYYHRRDVAFNPDDRKRIQTLLNSKWWTELGGMPIRQWDRIDGRRLILDKAWLAARFSGTEPLLRIYCEADQPETVQKLLDAAAEYLGV